MTSLCIGWLMKILLSEVHRYTILYFCQKQFSSTVLCIFNIDVYLTLKKKDFKNLPKGLCYIILETWSSPYSPVPLARDKGSIFLVTLKNITTVSNQLYMKCLYILNLSLFSKLKFLIPNLVDLQYDCVKLASLHFLNFYLLHSIF